MCGIVYVMRKDGKPARKRVLKKYYKQSVRGTDGYGYVALEGEKVQAYKRFMTEEETAKALELENSPHILFHHRYPTSTENLPESAHPIFVSHPELKHSYFVIHNGVISNDATLREEHLKLGYRYTTAVHKEYVCADGTTYTGGTQYNDSETLAIELARCIEGLQEEVRAKGSIALMAFQCDKTGKNVKALYYGRNEGNPLTIYEDNTQVTIASEGGKSIPADIMYRYNLKTGKTQEVDVPLQEYAVYKSTYGYSQSYGLDDEEDYEDYLYGRTPRGTIVEPPRSSRLLERGYSAEDYEEVLENIEADISIARQAGEDVEVEELEVERHAIMEEYQLFLDYEERYEGKLPTITA